MSRAAVEGPSASALPRARGGSPDPIACLSLPPSADDLPEAPLVPRQLGEGEPLLGTPFVVVRLLGQGGMGEVYEVEHRELGRHFAAKVLHRSHAGRQDLAARMRDEARSIGRLRHRSLPEVFDLGMTADGRPYFAMELLEGNDLRTELARLGVVAIPTALSLVAQALSALSLAHGAGIVHRDLKLENLFLCGDGTLKVLDFGVAKLLHGGESWTAPGAVVGTPRMMSPEQCAAGPIDVRADVYAMGLVLYELVTGRGPFDELRGQRDALRFAHCEREPPPPSRLAPQPIPEAVEQLILKALAKAPERRFQTAADMEIAVRRLLDRAARAALPVASVARLPEALAPTESDAFGLDARRLGGSAAAPREGAPVASDAASGGRRRAVSRPRLRAHPSRRRVRGVTRGAALSVCALALASAALGGVLAQRWLAWDERAELSAHAASQLRSAVR